MNYNIIYSHVISDESGTDEPVSIQDFKDYIMREGWSESGEEMDFTFDDVLIAEFIHSARQYLEELGNISIVPHEIEVVLNNYDRIELPFSPILQISSIVDANGDDVDEDDWKVIGNERKYLCSPTGQLTITYTTSALNDSRPLVDIKRIVAGLYENRGMDISEVVSGLSLFLPSYSLKSAIP